MPKLKLPRGSKIEIGILPEAGEVERPAAPDDPQKKKGAVFETDDDDNLYLRRGKLSIEVFDLGTRLRSVAETDFDGKRVRLVSDLSSPAPADGFFNEYVEQELSVSGNVEVDSSPGGFVRVNLASASVAALDTQILGEPSDATDAFGVTPANVTGRKLPNVMPFPFMNNFQVDVMIGDARFPLSHRETFSESDRLFPGDGEAISADARDAWKRREPKDSDASERWNPFNKGEGSSAEFVGGEWRDFTSLNPAFEQGTLSPKVGGGQRLAVAHGLNVAAGSGDVGFGLFETFDTSDTETFKITKLPHFEADEVPFSLPARKVRLYLKPRFVLHYSSLFNLTNFTQPLGDAFAFAGREPLYPFPPFADLREPSRATVAAYLARTPAARETLIRLRALYSGSTGVATPTNALHSIFEYSPGNTVRVYLNYSQVGMLVGVVAFGSARFYIWRKVTDAARFSGVYLMTGIDVPELAPFF